MGNLSEFLKNGDVMLSSVSFKIQLILIVVNLQIILNSLQVPYFNIHDPVGKYISLIIPAFNEEHRLPGALDKTMKL